MLREAVGAVGIHGVVNRNADWRPDKDNQLDEELSIILASLWDDYQNQPAAPAGAGTKPRFGVIPRITRSMARRGQLAATAARRRSRCATEGKQPAQLVAEASSDDEEGRADPTVAASPAHAAAPQATAMTPPMNVDEEAAANDGPPTALIDDSSRLHTPELRRGLLVQLAHMEDTLRDATRLG